MKWLFEDNPLRRWEPLGGVWIASKNFFVQDVKYLDLLGNEKDKEHFGSAICISVRVNMIVFAVWGEVLLPDLSFLSLSFSFSLFVFIFILSLFTSFRDRGFKIILCPWKVKDILLVRPSCKTFLSNFHGLPNRMWLTSIGTTSHMTSSLYFPMEKAMRTCLLIMISLSSLSHCNL